MRTPAQATTPRRAPLVATGGADVKVGAGTMGTTATNAIETHYAGCRFRSRLEARWAVFFDAIGIEWQYEPQGFEIESVYGREEGTWRYLPDFYLPKSNKWVEVKGDANAITGDYAQMLYHAIDWEATPLASGLILLGDIPDPTNKTAILHSSIYCRKGVAHGYVQFQAWGAGVGSAEWQSYNYYTDATCTPEDGLPRHASSRHVALQLVVGDRHDSYMAMERKVEQAYLAARRARFEFGETPTPPAKPTRTTARPADAARAKLAADRAEHATA